MKKLNLKNKLKISSIMTPFILAYAKVNSYATTIGTQEVETATQNIKDAVVKLAMPIRKCTYVCKYCNYCNKTNCKC